MSESSQKQDKSKCEICSCVDEANRVGLQCINQIAVLERCKGMMRPYQSNGRVVGKKD